METMRASWTDERLDDLSKKVDDGFSHMDDEFHIVRSEFGLVRSEIASLNRTVALGFAGIVASVLGSAMAAVLTHAL
jgi:phage-related minor tail protein